MENLRNPNDYLDEALDDYLLYPRFNAGKNAEFDNLLKEWHSEVERNKEKGLPYTKLQDYINNWIITKNKDFTHQRFKLDILNRKISVRFLFEPYAIVKGLGLYLFNIVVFLYKFSPYLLFPSIAYFENNWWLLGGIIVSIYSQKQSAKELENKSNFYNKFHLGIFINISLFIVIAALWIIFGFHHYIFWPFTILYGYNLFILAEQLQIHYGLKTLINKPDIYYNVVNQNLICIDQNSVDYEP